MPVVLRLIWPNLCSFAQCAWNEYSVKKVISGYPPVKCVYLISAATYKSFQVVWQMDIDILEENAAFLFRVG
jgi:hypothetical protein